MNSKILNATIKGGNIVPEKGLGEYKHMTHVKVLVISPSKSSGKRMVYKGAFKKGWGDPVSYQKKLRNEQRDQSD